MERPAQRRRHLAARQLQAAAQEVRHAIEQARIAETHLGLLRMDVDVDLFRRHVEEQEERRKLVGPPLVPHRAVEDREHRAVAQQPPIDENELPPAARRLG